jgi:hypothetical protein
MEGHDILNQHLDPVKAFLAKGSIKESDIAEIRNRLARATFLSNPIYSWDIPGFQRVTINSRIFNGQQKRIDDIKFLANPPVQYVKHYGRANFPNESVLYATFDPLTALSEMRPKVGDIITVSTWQLKTNHKLCVTPIFQNSTIDGELHNEMAIRAKIGYQKVLKQYDKNMQRQIEIITQFVSDCFSKEVDDQNPFDYYLSAHYAKRLFEELQNGEVEAIMYPSVRQSHTLSNIAIKPKVFDDNYHLTLVEESVITQVPTVAAPGWWMNATGHSKRFEDGKILWH